MQYFTTIIFSCYLNMCILFEYILEYICILFEYIFIQAEIINIFIFNIFIQPAPSQWGGERLFAITRKRKVEKSIRRCQIDHVAEGYKRANDKIRGPIAKNGFLGQNPKILAQKKPLLNPNHVPATTGQCCPKEKVPFYQIINGE